MGRPVGQPVLAASRPSCRLVFATYQGSRPESRVADSTAGPTKPARLIAFVLLSCAAWADQREEPVGLVLSPGGSKLLRFNTETPLAARPGDLLFAGDGLRTESTPAVAREEEIA